MNLDCCTRKTNGITSVPIPCVIFTVFQVQCWKMNVHPLEFLTTECLWCKLLLPFVTNVFASVPISDDTVAHSHFALSGDTHILAIRHPWKIMLKNSDKLTDRFIHLELSPLIYVKGCLLLQLACKIWSTHATGVHW